MRYHASKIFVFALPCALLIAPLGLVAEEGKTKFPAGDLTAIEVNLAGGQVQVMAWNDSYVTVERTKALPVSTDRGVLKIGAVDSIDKGPADKIKILAPDNLSLKITTKGARVDVQGFQSRVSILTVSGSAKVSSCSAPVDVETVSGKIDLRDIKGDVSLMTVSGTIRSRSIRASFVETKSVNGSQFLEDISTRQLRLRSHSGSVELEGIMAGDGFWDASTFDGDMRFEFDSGASIDLEAHSRSGQVRVDDNIAPREKANNYFRGRLGGGKTLVRLITFEGDIDVRVEH